MFLLNNGAFSFFDERPTRTSTRTRSEQEQFMIQNKQESRAVAGKPRDAAVNFARVCTQLFVSFATFTFSGR